MGNQQNTSVCILVIQLELMRLSKVRAHFCFTRLTGMPENYSIARFGQNTHTLTKARYEIVGKVSLGET